MGEAKRRGTRLTSGKRRELEELLENVGLVRRNMANMRAAGVTTLLGPPLPGGRRLDALDGDMDLWCDCTEAFVRAQLEGRAPTAEEVALAERMYGMPAEKLLRAARRR